jgi:hypothetical protein
VSSIDISPGLNVSSSAGVFGQRSFSAKQLQIAIGLASGGGTQPFAFTGVGGSTLTVTNARAAARITFAGGIRGSLADVAIWGLSQDRMNQFQTLGVEINKISRNILSVFAGDAVAGLSRVFTGNIIQAWGDYNAAPDVAIRFHCVAGYLEASQPFAATTFTGKVPVVQVFSSMAQQAGWGFFNNGVDQTIAVSNPYYPGSATDQFKKLAKDVQCNAMLLPGNTTGQNYVLFIWPKGGSSPTPGAGVAVISPQTGMIGYPTYQQNGMIMVRTLYNPAIAMGNQIQVNSSLFTNQSLVSLSNPASLWVVTRVDHALDTLIPKGQWMTTVFAAVNAPFKPSLPPPP